jgi:hypothetical protein
MSETSENVGTQSHSQGEPDLSTGSGGPAAGSFGSGGAGSDVGGPAQASESTTEAALDQTPSVADEEDPDDQGKNPL